MLPTRRSGKLCALDRRVIAETGVIPAGMRLIRDTYPFDVIDAQHTVKEDRSGREFPIMRVSGLIQVGDRENANGRYYPTREVLAPAVRNIQEDVSARAVMGEFDHPCRLTSDFRVLTVNGWKEFADVKVGDYVWSRIGGKMVRSRVNAIVDEPYDGTAYRVYGRNINDEFTPGHRFLLERRPDRNDYRQIYATVDDIYHNRSRYNHCRVPCTAELDMAISATITIPGLSFDKLPASTGGKQSAELPDYTQDLVFDARAFAAFIGLYLAEGSLHNKNGVYIYQKTETGRELVSRLLDNLHYDLKWSEQQCGFYVNDPRLANYLRPLGDKYTKYIPQDIRNLSPDCLEQLIYWFAIGDGRMLVAEGRDKPFLSYKSTLAANGGVAVENCLDLGKYSRLSIFTVSRRLIQDLHECVVKIGRCASLSEVASKDDYFFADHTIKADDKLTLYQLHISRRKGFNLDQRYTAIEPFHHKGRIYCLSVDHGNFYMEHKGCSFWTGNSDAKIHLDRVSHLMTKVWMDGRKVFGEAEILHNLPCGACLRGLFEHKVRVGISSRGVGDMEVVENAGKEMYQVLPGYTFVTWDAVAEPSVSGAILNIQESLNKRLRPIQKERNRFAPDVYNNILVTEINKFFDLE